MRREPCLSFHSSIPLHSFHHSITFDHSTQGDLFPPQMEQLAPHPPLPVLLLPTSSQSFHQERNLSAKPLVTEIELKRKCKDQLKVHVSKYETETT